MAAPFGNEFDFGRLVVECVSDAAPLSTNSRIFPDFVAENQHEEHE
jgi:hypothetical protein